MLSVSEMTMYIGRGNAYMHEVADSVEGRIQGRPFLSRDYSCKPSVISATAVYG